MTAPGVSHLQICQLAAQAVSLSLKPPSIVLCCCSTCLQVCNLALSSKFGLFDLTLQLPHVLVQCSVVVLQPLDMQLLCGAPFVCIARGTQ